MNISELADLAGDSLQYLGKAMELLPAPIYIKDLQGRFLNCNQAFAALWGKHSVSELTGRTLLDICNHPVAEDLHRRELTLLKNPGCRIDEIDMSSVLGRHCLLHFHACTTKDADGHTTGLVGLIFDITARADMEHRLESLSQIDELTQIANRRHGMSRLEELANHSARHGFAFSLLMVDIDHFKRVNDHFGHHIGDEILVQLSQRLSNIIRKSDMVFRYGGEEFVVLLPNTGAVGGLVLAQRFCKLIEATPFITSDGESHHLTISIGCASFPEQATAPSELLVMADDALYLAKNSGRNRAVGAAELSPSAKVHAG
jgi:diguanylate cyclase (GGDEF)-like protein/PAS domain S-box-containing protein